MGIGMKSVGIVTNSFEIRLLSEGVGNWKEYYWNWRTSGSNPPRF